MLNGYRRPRVGPPFWHEFDEEHEHDDADGAGGLDAPIKDDFYYAENVELTTVGIDVGSSTSHLMFSRLHLQRLGKYLSSRFVVVNRETLHRSPILLTPYRADNTIDAAVLDEFVERARGRGSIRRARRPIRVCLGRPQSRGDSRGEWLGSGRPVT